MPACFSSPECVGFCRAVRRLQQVGLSAFHPLSLAVGLRDYDRLCDSLILLIQESSPIAFAIESTRSYDVPLTRDPLHSAVWTFLSRSRLASEIGSIIRFSYPFIIPFRFKFRLKFALQLGQDLGYSKNSIYLWYGKNKMSDFHFVFSLPRERDSY